MAESFFLGAAIFLRIFSNPMGNVVQKKLTATGHHPLMVTFLTYLALSAITILPALQVKNIVFPPAFWMYALLAGLAGALGNGFLVKALQQGELSVMGPLNSYKSVVGMVFAIFLIGEVPGFWGVIGVVLIISGSYIILDTTRERFSWALLKLPAIQFRIWAMVLTAIEAVFIKKIMVMSTVMVSFISWCWTGALFSLVLLFFFRESSIRFDKRSLFSEWKKYGLLVVSVGVMQFATNYTFDHMPVGYALSLFQLSALLTVFLGRHYFDEKDIRKKVLGSLVMVAGSVIIILM
jgi:drug/metabolite transporter (DMT)-like permease